MEIQICERDVYIRDCLLLALDQKSLVILFNLFKTQYTLEKGHWLANKLERINIYEAYVCARTRVQTENMIYLHNLHKLLWRHITRFVSALRRRSLPPVFPRGVGTATRRLTRKDKLTIQLSLLTITGHDLYYWQLVHHVNLSPWCDLVMFLNYYQHTVHPGDRNRQRPDVNWCSKWTQVSYTRYKGQEFRNVFLSGNSQGSKSTNHIGSHRYQAHRVRHGSECSLGKYCNALQLTAVRISVRRLEICEKRNFARIFHLNAGLQRYSAPHFFGLPY